MKTGAEGIKLIESFETLALKAYQKVINGKLDKWTCGYGHTGLDVGPLTTCTVAQAGVWLAHDLAIAEGAVNSLGPVLTQNRYDALVAFAFNVGVAGAIGSTMFRLIRAGAMDAAALEFPKWDHVNGQVSAGLLRRREAEKALFETP